MSNTAFGVAQTSAGVGTTDTDMRHILAAQWDSTGVINGLAVTGTTSLYYRVAAGVAVCSKGPSDGKTLAYLAGGSTPTVSANSSGNPRIDCIWVTSHDLDQGDADNLVTLGVTQGTPAATPTAPSIPTYATLLAQMVMPAGATTTANAHHAASVGYAIPYGASLGVLHSFLNTFDGIADTSATWYTEDSATFFLPTDRLLEFRYARCMSSNDAGNLGSILMQMSLDGAPFVQSEMLATAYWETHEFNFVKSVSAGNHTFSVANRHWAGGKIHYLYNAGSGRGTAYQNGLTCQIIDRGVVR